MTPEEIQALEARAAAAEAKAEQAAKVLQEKNEQIAAAGKIQRGYLKLKEQNQGAAEYLDAIARGEEPRPFWKGEESMSDDVDPFEGLEQRLTAQLEKKIGDLGALVNSRFEAVAKPVLNMQAQRAEDSVRTWALDKYPGLNWDDFKSKSGEMAGIRKDLLEDEQGLQILVKNYWSDQAEQAGYARAQGEFQAQSQLESSILMPDSLTGDRSVEADPFDGIAETDMSGMLAKARDLAIGR